MVDVQQERNAAEQARRGGRSNGLGEQELVAQTLPSAARNVDGGLFTFISCRVPLVANVGIGMRLAAQAVVDAGAATPTSTSARIAVAAGVAPLTRLSVTVARVLPRSAAAAGDVRVGDELVSIAGRALPIPPPAVLAAAATVSASEYAPASASAKAELEAYAGGVGAVIASEAARAEAEGEGGVLVRFHSNV